MRLLFAERAALSEVTAQSGLCEPDVLFIFVDEILPDLVNAYGKVGAQVVAGMLGQRS
jgi:hypothetical protein